MKDREVAMNWWDTLSDNLAEPSKFNLAQTHFNKHWMGLTGSEIEEIWRKETKPQYREFNNIKYRIDKTPCTCICHKHNNIIHVRACCNNGFEENLSKAN